MTEKDTDTDKSETDTELNRSEALRRTLKTIANAYNEGKPVDVEWADDVSAASEDGTRIAIEPDMKWSPDGLSGAEKLAILANTVSHEVEHIRESELSSKKKFMRKRPEGATIAGAVLNTVEDQFIDRTRTERWRGLKGTQAFTVDTVMADDQLRPPLGELDNVTQQMVEGLIQASFAGNVKGLEDAPEDVQNFLAWARDRVDVARYESDAKRREGIAGTIYDTLKRVAEENDEFDPQAGADHVMNFLPDGEEIADEVHSMFGDFAGDPGSMHDPTGGRDHEGPDLDEFMDGDGDGEGEGKGEGECEGDPAGSGSGGGCPRIDPDSLPGESDAGAVERTLERMRNGDPTQSAEWYDADPDAELDLSEFERRLEEVRELEREEQTELGEEIGRRDALVRQHQVNPDYLDADRSYSHEHGDIERLVRNRELDREIEEAFRRFTTADDHVPGYEGQRINIPAAVEFEAGNFGREDLYLTSKPLEHGDRVVGVSLDVSGSMSGSMDEAKVALAAFWLATEEIGDTFVANTFYEGKRKPEDKGGPTADLLIGPDEAFKWEYLDAARDGGNTPTALGMSHLREHMEPVEAREKLMVVVTDGLPNVVVGVAHDEYDADVYPYADDTDAIDESQTYVDALREDGYAVIGVAVNDDIYDETMDAMFGETSWIRTDVGDLAETLIEIYRGELNPAAA